MSWIQISLVAGFLVKLFILFAANSMTDTRRYATFGEKIMQGFFVLAPVGTGMIFYVIPFILSPWLGK